jgi:Asp-tRNA(Asn)/Glu-tRNA(Gln) amidotransferase A subunit family amidase
VNVLNDRVTAATVSAVRPTDRLPDLVAGVSAVREGRLKPSDWLRGCIERIEAYEPLVKAFEYFDREQVESTAKRLDSADWSKWRITPRLAGAPLAIKDIFNTRDMPNSMGSDIRRGYQPGNDARVVEHATHLGGYPIGKTTTAEFAVHTSPPTLNPWNAGIIAGTSSTGSAVAVACGMAPAALGTQSAGSITRPSSYNGLVGYKPTFGLIPRTGVLKTCDTLDTIGWLTRSVRDARLLLDCLRVRGHNYPQVVRGFRAAEERRPQDRPWRIGFGGAPGLEHAKKSSREALDLLALQIGNRSDVEIIDLDLTGRLRQARDVHRVIYHKSLSYYFTRDMAHVEKISEIFKELVDEGQRFTMEEYVAALNAQEQLSKTFESAMQDADVFLTLSTSGEAPKLGVPEPPDSSLVWTLCGAPLISLPLFQTAEGLPFGAQLVAQRYGDYALLDFAESVFPGLAPLVTPKA